MSAAPQLPFDAEVYSRRKRFTRQEVEWLHDLNFFEGQRYELIDGELLDKMGQDPPHASTIRRLNAILGRIFGERLLVQLPVKAAGADRDRSIPEPDLAVLRRALPVYDRRHPRGDELPLAIEVADSSARLDKGRKAEIYANAGVAEYWIIDLNENVVLREREPRGGRYRVIEPFSPGDTVPVPESPEGIAATEILPSAD